MSKVLVKGNEAIAQAAINAGCQCYFGYPITPQSEIGEYMGAHLPKLGRVFVTAESELASINMVIGAGTTGTKAMTSSSSCGIALMQESISAMCCAEVPGVIVSVMRGGPGLGNIAPAQADYFQALKGGGNGDYKTLVLSPSTVQEAIDLTYRAFHLSLKYRNPVMLLADGILGQMMEPAEFGEYPYEDPDVSEWALNGADNRAPRNIVSLHMPEGAMEELTNKLFDKYKAMEENETTYEDYMLKDAKLVLTAFGTVGRVAKTAVKKAREAGMKVGLFRPVTLFPFPDKDLYKVAKNADMILDLELNKGQMLLDVRSAVFGACPVEFYGRTAGGLLTPDSIYEKICDLYKTIDDKVEAGVK
ncbi:MAG: 3-methyl-2-oxobutanoate dehydrogenase subunit VorB [Clostridium sp.]|nr:3-methyl-2-oxobutanoate dehydrogenase subunit VorB [Clostridium sp.]